LLKLKPHRLKIDGQLIRPITQSEGQRHLVESIIEIGRSLDIAVTAEGVETAEHIQVLRALGCDVLQGYAFAKAMTAEDLGQFLAGQAWRSAS
jgi:EAL domain-containing protein (putative c-di-GMP-specific phosphodiesterase class I)